MRDIKFRSWNANEKRMVAPCLWINECNLPSSQMCSAPTHPLMQFTGLKDLEGTDIYEGDILHQLDPLSWSPMEVGFQDGAFFVDAGDSITWIVKLSSEYVNKNELVIVGNIHENPELLGCAE